MDWRGSASKPAKMTPEDMVARLKQIQDRMLDESRAQFEYVKSASDNFKISLAQIKNLAMAMQARIAIIEQRINQIERDRGGRD